MYVYFGELMKSTNLIDFVSIFPFAVIQPTTRVSFTRVSRYKE